MMAPVAPPAPKPKPRARRFVAWSLCFFAGGLAAGPVLADYADQGLEAAIGWLATSAPQFLQPYLPKPLPTPTPIIPSTSASGAAPRTLPTTPVAAPPVTEVPAPPEPTPEVPAPEAAPAPVAAAPVTDPPAPPARARRAHPARRKVVAALEPEAKEPKPKAVVAPTPEEKHPVKARDPLDDLMGGGPRGNPNRPTARRNTSKEIDAMLMDVQKSLPPTPPKRAAAAPLPPLTAADIAKAMAGVKRDAKACGKRFGESGVADLKLTVGKDGRIAKVALGGELASRSLAQCVIKAARGAAFPPNAGLKFDYRIDL